MEHTWILIVFGVLVLLAAIAFVAVSKRAARTGGGEAKSPSAPGTLAAREGASLSPAEPRAMTVTFETLPALTERQEAALVEVKDKKLLARIDNAIPGAAQVIANAGAAQAAQKAAQAGGKLYQAIIPKGAELVRARDMEGAVRGFYRGDGGIKGHADLLAVDNPANGLAAMNIANAAMGAAAMVVGQYYMTQINDQLEEISGEIKTIASFQDKEYQSKIYALVAAIQKSSQFQLEIMENEELRKLELEHLKGLEHECAQLLGQANLTLEEFGKKKGLDFEEYEKAVAEAQIWYQYQQVLLEIMLKIEELTYALSLGQVSKENCYALFLPYLKQAQGALSVLERWHEENGEALEIDLEAGRRRLQGLEGALMAVPAFFKDDLHYREVPKDTAEMISKQLSPRQDFIAPDDPDLFREDVKLIAKEGKLYYLPGADSEVQEE